MKTVLVLGGTVDGRRLAGRLAEEGYRVILSVATGHGRELAGRDQVLAEVPATEPLPATMPSQACPAESGTGHQSVTATSGLLEIRQGRLDQAGMSRLMGESAVSCLVDATHPYALEVSRTAMAACARSGIPYLRFERPATLSPGAAVHRVPDQAAAIRLANGLPGKIFLAVGGNNAALWGGGINDPQRLVIRILPVGEVLQRCTEAGFSADRIIAMQGPFSQAMNREHFLWAHAGILVTKDGGREGGTPEKLAAADELGMVTILIERPELEVPQRFASDGAILEQVRRLVPERGI